MWISILKYKMCIFFVSVFYLFNYLHKRDFLQKCIIVTTSSGYFSRPLLWLVELWCDCCKFAWLVVSRYGPNRSSVLTLRSDRNDELLLLPPMFLPCCNHHIMRYNYTFQGKHIIVPILTVHFMLYFLNGNVYYVMGISTSSCGM